jgi:hypothetical protein
MKEPKRLAHRQAERNKARALKHWDWDEDELSEPLFAAGESPSEADAGEFTLSYATTRYQL